MQRPSILFVMADDHTSQAWGCYGSRLAPSIRTPNIDRLAAEGARLENCFCTNSICTPSRATILTGQYSHMNGVRTLQNKLDPTCDTLTKRLQATGYATAIFGKWHLGSEPCGFDHYNVYRAQGEYLDPLMWQRGQDWNGSGVKHHGHETDVVTDLTIEWLSSQEEQGRPFFCMCHYKAPHEPFYSHERYRRLYEDVVFPEPEDLLWASSPLGKVFAGWPLEETFMRRCLEYPNDYAPPPLDINGLDPTAARQHTYQKLIHDYMRTVAGIDDNLGRLLGYLDIAGLAQDTLVIYTSDQGYFLGEHNLFDKRFMLEESLRMPFVARYPREIPPGMVNHDIITNVDFPETILDYAGAQIAPMMQGRSFRGNLRGATPSDWPGAMYYHYWTPGQPARPSHYGVRTRQHKLIYYYGLVRDDGRAADDCWEFYDLECDPSELVNRYADAAYADVITRLRRQLDALRQQYGDTSDPATSYPTKAGGARPQ